VLTAVLWFVGLLPLAVIIDWLACTRGAAYFIDYEYSYRPGKLRYTLLVLAAAFFAYTMVADDPSRQSITDDLIFLLIMMVWSLLVWRDVKRALVPSELAPKRYSDSDY
jgi:hypothetical protein